MPEIPIVFVLWWRLTPSPRQRDSHWIRRATGTRQEISEVENRIVDDEPGNHDFLVLPEGQQP
jgi:hypothetical protein